MRGATRAREREQAIIAAGWTRSSPTRYSSDKMQSGSKNCSGGPQSAFCHGVGRVAEWFKAAVLKTARGFTLPRGFESHPFRQGLVRSRPPPSDKPIKWVLFHSFRLYAFVAVRYNPTNRHGSFCGIGR